MKRPDFSQKKQRNIDINESHQIEVETKANEEEIKRIVENNSLLKEKINTLQKSFDKMGGDLKLKVTRNTVKAAVKRRDPASDGEHISYDLFNEAVKKTGWNKAVDKANEYIKYAFDDVKQEWDEAQQEDWMAVAAFAMVKILAKAIAPMVGQLLGIDIGESVVAGAVAAMMEYHDAEQEEGDTEDAIFDRMKDSLSFDEPPSKSEVAKAQNELEESQQEYRETRDWNLIRDHVYERLPNEIEQELRYMAWVGSQSIDEDRSISRQMEYDATRYTYDFVDDSMGDLADYSNAFKYGVDNTVAMGEGIADLFSGQTDSLNKALNGWSTLLSTHYGKDMLCCLVRALDGLDIEFLKDLNKMLKMITSTLKFDFSNMLNKQIERMNSSTKHLIVNQIIHIINEFKARVLDDLKEWLKSNDPDLEMLFLCTPVDELMNYLIKFINNITGVLIDAIKKLWESLRIKKINLEMNLGILMDYKLLKNLQLMINQAIHALDRGDLCKATNRSSETELAKIVDKLESSLQDGVDSSLKIYSKEEAGNNEEINIFSKFVEPEPITTVYGHVVKAGRRTTVDNEENALSACIANLSEKTIKGYTK